MQLLQVTHSKDCRRKIVLPSSYTGSPRQMFELYQDAMSIVRKYGKPDLFITFTCNPLWEEITSALLLDQKASDRPGALFTNKTYVLLNIKLK